MLLAYKQHNFEGLSDTKMEMNIDTYYSRLSNNEHTFCFKKSSK